MDYITPSTSRGSVRRALSIALSYAHLALEHPGIVLTTSLFDPPKIRDLLIDVYKYKESDITILCDDDPENLPVRKRIIQALHDLVKDARPGDEFWFHFSGHGSQVKNLNGTEKDGLDEVIFPYDIRIDSNDQDWRHTRNYIMDDEIHDIIVKPLPARCSLTIVFDSCHSGTAADLPFCHECATPLSPNPRSPLWGNLQGNTITLKQSRLQNQDTQKDSLPSETYLEVPSWERMEESPDRSVPHVICWSACRDNETTFETDAQGGLFVEVFTQALRRNPDAHHDELLEIVR